MSLTWNVRRNLEDSFCYFLTDKIATDGLTVLDNCGNEVTPQVTVGFPHCDEWSLPVISAYIDDTTSPRACIGSNARLDEYLMIIDIRSANRTMQLDLTDWIKEAINDGFTFYEYQPNTSDLQNPLKTDAGYTSIDFVSNVAVRLADNVDLFDKFRQNITVTCYINRS